MKPIELGSKIADLVWGKKVEGTVAAVIPTRVASSDRYVVDTGRECLDVHVRTIENHDPVFYTTCTSHTQLKRGQEIHRRSFNIRPWVEGQIL